MNKKILLSLTMIIVFAFVSMGLTACGERLQSISLDVSNVVTEIEYNQDLDLSGLIVTAHFEKTERVLKSNEYTIDTTTFDKTVSGHYNIIIKYKDKQKVLQVYVKPDLMSATGLRIDTSNAKTSFEYGEDFSRNNVEVFAVDAGGEYLLADTEYVLDSSNYNKNVSGEYDIIISLIGTQITTTYTVVVQKAPVESIEVDTTAVKTIYEWGEAFDSTGLVVYKVLADGSREQTLDYTINSTQFDSSIAGVYGITIRLNTDYLKFDIYLVTVNERLPADVTDIAIDTTDVKKLFGYGEYFDSSNLKVTKIMSYGDPILALPSEYTIDDRGFSNTSPGQHTIYVHLNETQISKSYTVTVAEPVLTGIRLETRFVKSTYYLGEAFSSRGLIVYKVYEGDFEQEANEQEFTLDYDSFDNTLADTYTIDVILGAYQESFEVEVLNEATIVGVEIDATNATILFDWGQAFSSDGLVVKKIMSYGEPIVVSTSDYILDASTFNSEVAGEYRINIDLRGTLFSTYYTVEVGQRAPAQVVDIALDTANAILEFGMGENFSSEGIVVKKVMSYGEDIIATANEYTVNSSAFDTTVKGTYDIVVTLNGTQFAKTYQVQVVDAKPVITGIDIDTTMAKLAFDWGETFEPTGLIVNYVYSDNSKTPCQEYEIDSTDYDRSVAGQYTIRVIYGQYEEYYYVEVNDITQSVAQEFLQFEKVKLSFGDEEFDIEYISNVQNYTIYYTHTAILKCEVVTKDALVSVDFSQCPKYLTMDTTIIFTLHVLGYTQDYSVNIITSSPARTLIFAGDSISIDSPGVIHSIEANSIHNPSIIEMEWSIAEGFYWELDGVKQTSNVISKDITLGSYVVHVKGQVGGRHYTLNTITIYIYDVGIVQSIEMTYDDPDSDSLILTQVGNNNFVGSVEGFVSNIDFDVTFMQNNSYTTTWERESQYLKYGDNFYNIYVHNGSDLVMTIHLSIHLTFDFTLLSDGESGVWVDGTHYLTTTVKKAKDIDNANVKFYNAYNTQITEFNTGENALTTILTKGGEVYSFDTCINVQSLGVDAITINNDIYPLDSKQSTLVISSALDSVNSIKIDFDQNKYQVLSNDINIVSGQVSSFEFDEFNNSISIRVLSGEIISQNIVIIFVQSTYIAEVGVVENDLITRLALARDNTYRGTFSDNIQDINIDLVDGYEYALYKGDVLFDGVLYYGDNLLTINVYNDSNELVESRLLNITINTYDLTVRDTNNTSVALANNISANTLGILGYSKDVIGSITSSVNNAVYYNGALVSNNNISLQDNVTTLEVKYQKHFTICVNLVVVKEGAKHPSQYLSTLSVKSNIINLATKDFIYKYDALYTLNSGDVSLVFTPTYTHFTYQVSIEQSKYIVYIYNQNALYDRIDINTCVDGMVDDNVKVLGILTNLSQDDKFRLDRDDMSINLSALQSSTLNIRAINSGASVNITGQNCTIYCIGNVGLVYFDIAGNITLTVSIKATNGDLCQYTINVGVSERQAIMEVSKSGQTITFGAGEGDNTFVYHEPYYTATFDYQSADIQQGKVNLTFTLQNGVSVYCGQEQIVNGNNLLSVDEIDGIISLDLTLNYQQKEYLLKIYFKDKTELANITVAGKTKRVVSYSDGLFGEDAYMSSDNAVLYIFGESAVNKNNMTLVINVGDLLAGFGVYSMNGQPYADISNIVLNVTENVMGTFNIYSASFMLSDGENVINVMLYLSDVFNKFADYLI